jgi:hypothetical protein
MRSTIDGGASTPLASTELLDQLLANPGVRLARGGRFQVGARPARERAEVFEISDLLASASSAAAAPGASPHGASAAPCGLARAFQVGVVVGEAHLGVHRLAGSIVMIFSSSAGAPGRHQHEG